MKTQTDQPTATANEYSPWIPYILWSTAGGTGCGWLISEEAVAAYEAYLLADEESPAQSSPASPPSCPPAGDIHS